MVELTELEEETLNKAPQAYRVAFRTKIFFLVFVVLGMSLYGYLIVHRRMAEGRFQEEFAIQAVRVMPYPMPPFKVHQGRSGDPVDLRFDEGQFTLLNIWATWCPPCQKEMPSLARLAEEFRDQLRVVALSMDDDAGAVKDFVVTTNPSFLVFWDKEKLAGKHLGVEKYPETFLIAPDGKVVTQFSGPRDWSSEPVMNYFLNIFKEPTPKAMSKS
jgi:thiol-disulfide isomerase/thioredoxin